METIKAKIENRIIGFVKAVQGRELEDNVYLSAELNKNTLLKVTSVEITTLVGKVMVENSDAERMQVYRNISAKASFSPLQIPPMGVHLINLCLCLRTGGRLGERPQTEKALH